MYASQFVELGAVRRRAGTAGASLQQGAARLAPAAARRFARQPACRRSQGQMPMCREPRIRLCVRTTLPVAEPRCSGRPQPSDHRHAGHLARCWKADVLGDWPRQARGGASIRGRSAQATQLLNVTRLRKTFTARRGLAAWRLSVAAGRPRLRISRPQVPAVDGVSLSIVAGRGAGSSAKAAAANHTARPPGAAAAAAERRQRRIRRRRSEPWSPARTSRRSAKQAQIVFQNVGSR